MWVDRIEVWIYSQSQKSTIHTLNLEYNRNVRPSNILVSNFVLILLYSLKHFQLNRIFSTAKKFPELANKVEEFLLICTFLYFNFMSLKRQ